MPHSAPHPLDALRTVRDLLLAVEDPEAQPAALVVVGAIDAWFAEGGDFAAHLGLAPGWHSAMRQREQRRAIREAAERHFGGMSCHKQARAMAAAALAYETTRWPQDRAARHRPDGLSGCLFDILSAGPMLAAETLRKCIG